MAAWAGCGEGDANDRPLPADGARAQIEENLPRIQAQLAAGDGEAVCRGLSDAGAIEVVTSGIGHLTKCPDAIAVIAARGSRAGIDRQPWRVRKVTRVGNKAVAEAMAGPDDMRSATFVKTPSGGWKLESLSDIAPRALDNDATGPGHDFGDPRGSEETRVAEVVYDVQGDFPRGLGNSVCHELTAAGRREIERSAVGSGNCQGRIPAIARRARAAGLEPLSSRIVWVRVNGRRATALLRDPGAPPYRVAFELGEPDWKLPSLADLLPVAPILAGQRALARNDGER